MIVTILWFTAGLALMITGAELLVRGASRLAASFGISKLIIGLTVVAFGTSAPELAVSIQAGFEDKPDIMLGNIVGSNITNILLILGLSALIIPLKVNPRLIRLEVPVMIGLTLLLLIFVLNGSISFWESLIFVILLIIYLVFLARNSGSSVAESPVKKKKYSRPKSLIYTLFGLIMLVTGARWLVDSAVLFAEAAGVTELVIGLTVVAIGTSLPEITTSIVAAIRRERELVISSVVGSNILNILAVLGITGVILPDPIPVTDALIRFDIMLLLAASFACIPIFFTGHVISRAEGALFFGYFLAYVFYLWLSSAEHLALTAYSYTMLAFVLPITLLTLLTVAIRELRKRRRIWKSIHMD